jgi:pimeloyl-ACP methyl ester carboxylesterase
MSKLRVREIELAYNDEGQGPSVVLLHGYPFNRSLWREQVDDLKGSFRVVAPDLRGHGETEVAPATIEAMARDVEALMTALEIPNAILGGLSMGGYVALAFCRLFPLRVRGLILADTRASADTEQGKQNRSQQREQILQAGMRVVADEMLTKLFAPATLAKPSAAVEHVRQMILQTKPDGAAAALTAMAERDDQTSFISQIRSPTLIVCGRHDVITPLADSEFMHHEISGSQLVVIEEAGHVSNLEQPKQFNRALREFLRSDG